MSIVSYAQNFEDVLLWRALGHIERGRYLDIGAQDPLVDSVSLAFYERGWRGLHVEAAPFYASRLREARPEEIVVEAAVADSAGPIEFFEIEGTGISTGRSDIADFHKRSGFEPRRILVPTVSLSQLLQQIDGDIHWMKLDVEGMEGDALRSWDDNSKRPWILIVEATYPSTQESTRAKWIDEVLRRGYEQVHFDGLSCFFVHEAHRELGRQFNAPPNVFDQFIIAPPHFAAARIRGELEAAQHAQFHEQSRADRLQSEVASAQLAAESLRHELVSTAEQLNKAEQGHLEYRRESDKREQILHEEIRRTERAVLAGKIELARLEERSAQLQDKLERADARATEQHQTVTEVVGKLSQVAAENGQLRAAVARADTLIRGVIAGRPGPWEKLGEVLGVSGGRSQRLRALSAWVTEPPSGCAPSTPSPASTEGNYSIMPSADNMGARNPYLRANSLAELMSWHDINFVRCAYVTVLGRQPDRLGEEYYVDRLRRGYSKYGILWQLRTSPEGPLHDPGIAGFDRELRKHRNARHRLYGWVIRSVTGRESDSPLERRIRAIENLLGFRAATISAIELESVIRQSVSEAFAAVGQSPTPGAHPPQVHTDLEAVRGRLSPNGRKIFDRVYSK